MHGSMYIKFIVYIIFFPYKIPAALSPIGFTNKSQQGINDKTFTHNENTLEYHCAF